MLNAIPVYKWKFISAIFCVMLAVGVQLLPNSAAAQSQAGNTFNPDRLGWSRLLFNGSAFMGKISVDVQLALVSPQEANRALIPSPRGRNIPMESPKIGHLFVHRTIDPRFRSKKITEEDNIWFNPTRASALGRSRMRRGDDDFLKIYRFTEQGVFRIQKEPADDELSLSPDKWTDIKENFYVHDLKQMNCAAASERSVILYITSVGAFSDNPQPISLCVLGKRQLHRVRLSAAGVQRLNVEYAEKKGDTRLVKADSVEALKIALETEPLKADLEEDENFSFLGLRSNVAIFIDPASQLPLQISGKVPGMGTLQLKLTEVIRPISAD